MDIGVIGTGIIASAVVTGFCEKAPGHKFHLSPRNAEKAAALAEKYPEAEVRASNQDVLDRSEMVFISLLFKDFYGALKELKFRADHKVVNMSAGFRPEDIKKVIGETALLAHAVPLPFIRRGIGPIAIYPGSDEVRKLFGPLGDVVAAESIEDVEIFQAVTSLMSAYNALLHEVSLFSERNGIGHNASVQYLCSLFSALCTQANVPDADLYALSREMTPGGYNEQALTELLGNGAIEAWGKALDRLLKRLRGEG